MGRTDLPVARVAAMHIGRTDEMAIRSRRDKKSESCRTACPFSDSQSGGLQVVRRSEGPSSSSVDDRQHDEECRRSDSSIVADGSADIQILKGEIGYLAETQDCRLARRIRNMQRQTPKRPRCLAAGSYGLKQGRLGNVSEWRLSSNLDS